MYSDDVQARGSEDAMSVLRGRADVFSVHTYFGSSIFSCRTIEMQVYVESFLVKPGFKEFSLLSKFLTSSRDL